MLPIFRTNYKYGLKEDDLFDPLEEHRSERLGEQLERIWYQEHKKHKKTALHVALFKLFGLPFTLLGLLKAVNEIILV